MGAKTLLYNEYGTGSSNFPFLLKSNGLSIILNPSCLYSYLPA